MELVLEADRETLRQYPFLFRFTCVFTLTAAGLAITRRVENTGKEKMYFSVGEHLGLSLTPWGGSLENYALVFPAAQTAWNWQLNKGLLDKKTPYLDNTDTLPLSKALFQTYGCLVLQGLSAPWVALRPSGTIGGSVSLLEDLLQWWYGRLTTTGNLCVWSPGRACRLRPTEAMI